MTLALRLGLLSTCVVAVACGSPNGLAGAEVGGPASGATGEDGGDAGAHDAGLRDGGQDAGPGAPDAGDAGDAGDAPDAGTVAPPRDGGPVITFDGGAISIPAQAPYDTWTYIPTPGAICGNGSATGLGINPHAGATNLLIFLVGGGMCFDYATCFVAKTASNLTGYNQTDLDQAITSDLLGKPGVLRRDPTNPFKDYNLVVLPYCTGDLFAGTVVQDFKDLFGQGHTLYQVGHYNILHYLAQLVPTFAAAATQVILTGSSAGGFGALLNYEIVKGAFGGTETILIDDSGPVMRDPYLANSLMTTLWNTWDLSNAIPSSCNCSPSTGFSTIYDWVAQDPTFRGSLISSEQDKVIKDFLTIGNPLMQLGTYFQEGLNDVYTNVLKTAGPGQFKVFFVQSDAHVWLEGLPYVGSLDGGHLPDLSQVITSGVSLESFLTAQVTHDGGWDDVLP